MSSPFFTNKGKKWPEEEDQQLQQEYVQQQMNVLDIAKTHKRTVGSIVSRLKNLSEIPTYIQSDQYEEYVRGYSEYLQDEEFLQLEKESRKKKEKTPPSLLHPDRDVEIAEMKRDIAEIKKGMKEILTLLQSIYEFEQEE